MKILVISDNLFQDADLYKNESDLEVISWDENNLKNPGSNDAIIVDMTFSTNKPTERERQLLNELKVWFSKDNYIGSNTIILVIICASEDKLFEFSRENYPGYGEIYIDDVKEDFSTYDFIKGCIPSYSNNVIFRPCGYRYIMPLTPAREYLEVFSEGISYLFYCYLKNPALVVEPLATLKKDSTDYPAFKCAEGKATIITLPGYNRSKSHEAESLLLKVCRTYFKRINPMDLTETFEHISSIKLKNLIYEAAVCYMNDLLVACLIMCRRTLEESVAKKGGKRWLKKKIDHLFEFGFINEAQKVLADEIVTFGNWGAHADKFQGKSITDNDARNVLEFLCEYFKNIRMLEKIEISKLRQEDLKKVEGVK